MTVKELSKTPPFSGRLNFIGTDGIAEIESDRTVVVCMERSRAYAKKIKEKLSEKCEVLLIETRDMNNLSSAVISEGETVVAVCGGEDLLYLKRKDVLGDNRLIAVLTDLTFSYAFKKTERFIGRGGVEEKEVVLPEKVFVDLSDEDIVKRAALADAVACCARLLSFRTETELMKEVEAVNERALERADEIINTIEGAGVLGEASSVIKAQMLLAKFYYDFPDACFDAAFFVGKILRKTNAAVSAAESEYAAAKALISFYSLCVRENISSSLCPPDYDGRLQKLSALFSCDEYAFLKDFEPFDERYIYEVLNKITGAPRSVKCTNEALKTLEKCERVYSAVYGGRKKRADLTKSQAAFALAEGAYLSEGLLKILGDGGITEALPL